jgi:type I restriction enzyme S subunit
VSPIAKLTRELAPEGVQLQTLGDLGEFIRGNGLQKSDLTEEGAPAIHYGQIHTHYGTWADLTKSFTDPVKALRLRRAKSGDLIIATTSEDDAAVAKATAWIGEGEVAVSGDAYIYQHTLDPRYVAYFFQTEQFQQQKTKHITGTKVRRISGTALAKVRIPVPPLQVQHEIVRILDRFFDLEKALESELVKEVEARRRQYAYYRDELLTFSDTSAVQRTPIGGFSELVRGNGMPKTDLTDEGVPAIHYGQIYTYYDTWATKTKSFVTESTAAKLANVDKGDIIITNTSENIEDVGKAVAWLGDDQAVTGGHATVIKHRQNPKYLAYYFQTSEFDAAKRRHATGTKVIDVPAKGLAKIEIPLPPREEQDRLVKILDDFSAAVSDLSRNLPAELNARRVQYAHYRDQLLTFEKATV